LALVWPRAAQALDKVTFASTDGTQIAGYVMKPEGAGPFPTLVLLHGCGGLLNRRDEMPSRERDWAARFIAAGYAVIFPDSFNPRGFRSVCSERDREINPAGRARDAAGAVAWLKTQAFVARDKIMVVGWSHGGSTVLRFVAGRGAGEVAGAIAFYPGCSSLVKRGGWASRVPLTILMGAEDDWTPAEPCRQLAATGGPVRIETYPGAYHGFDSPDSKLRTRKGMAFSANGTGVVHVGTHPAARQAAIAATMKFLGERMGR
jgi:dienelactone hydrolase